MRYALILATVVSTLIGGGVYAAQWELDKAHTNVGFKVTHMMVAKVTGYFGEFDANVQLDQVPPTQMSIDATIKTASIDTKNEKRDGHLRSADFFDVDTYPEITFKSKRFEQKDGHGRLTGDLTMRGVTKEVTFEVTGFDQTVKDPRGNLRAAGSATATINRKDWGLNWNVALEAGGVLVSETVNIVIDAEISLPSTVTAGSN